MSDRGTYVKRSVPSDDDDLPQPDNRSSGDTNGNSRFHGNPPSLPLQGPASYQSQPLQEQYAYGQYQNSDLYYPAVIPFQPMDVGSNLQRFGPSVSGLHGQGPLEPQRNLDPSLFPGPNGPLQIYPGQGMSDRNLKPPMLSPGGQGQSSCIILIGEGMHLNGSDWSREPVAQTDTSPHAFGMATSYSNHPANGQVSPRSRITSPFTLGSSFQDPSLDVPGSEALYENRDYDMAGNFSAEPAGSHMAFSNPGISSDATLKMGWASTSKDGSQPNPRDSGSIYSLPGYEGTNVGRDRASVAGHQYPQTQSPSEGSFASVKEPLQGSSRRSSWRTVASSNKSSGPRRGRKGPLTTQQRARAKIARRLRVCSSCRRRKVKCPHVHTEGLTPNQITPRTPHRDANQTAPDQTEELQSPDQSPSSGYLTQEIALPVPSLDSVSDWRHLDEALAPLTFNASAGSPSASNVSSNRNLQTPSRESFGASSPSTEFQSTALLTKNFQDITNGDSALKDAYEPTID